MSRTKKSSWNVVSAFMSFLLNMVLSFIARIIFVRFLSASYLGINGLFVNILSILSVVDLGIPTAMAYSLYKPLSTADHEKIRNLIAFFRRIYLIIAFGILAIGLILLPFLNYLVNLDKPIDHLQAYYLLSLANVVVSYLYSYRTILLVADQRQYILNNYVIFFRIITFVFQTVTLILFKNYLLYLFVALIINIISNLVQNKVTILQYPYLKEKSFPLMDTEKRKIKQNVIDLFIYKIGTVFQGNTDNILISIFVGTVYVGYYSNYMMIINAIVSLISLCFNGVKASVGNLIASSPEKSEEKIFIFHVFDLINFWIVSFCSICCACLFQDFIFFFFGEQYVLDYKIVIAIIIVFYTNNIRQTMWMFRETSGIFHETRFVTTVTAILNIVLSVLLGIKWGMFGVLIATSIGRMLYAWWKEPIVLFHHFFHTSSKKYFLNYITRIILCICSGIVTFWLCCFINFQNILLTLVAKIVICLFIPNMLLLLMHIRSNEFQYIYNKMIIVGLKKNKQN